MDDSCGDPWWLQDRPGPAGSERPGAASVDPLFTKLAVLCTVATRVTGVDGASIIALVSTCSSELVYATNAVAERIEELQFTVGEGPCVDAYSSGSPQLWPRVDATGSCRWLAFSNAIHDLGVAAIFAFPVPGPVHTLAVLELHRRTPGPLDAEQLNRASDCAGAVGQAIMATVPPQNSPSVATLYAEAALMQPGNSFARSMVSVAAEMVALQLNVCTGDALVRVRAHAYARDESVTTVGAEIMSGRLVLLA